MPSLNHPFAALEREGSIERVGPDAGEVARLHAVVDRDRATAEYLRTRDHDWTLAIVYNGMLQACQALMAAYGYRSRGDHQHRTSIEFVRIALPGHVTLLDRLIGSAASAIARSTTSRGRRPRRRWRTR